MRIAEAGFRRFDGPPPIQQSADRIDERTAQFKQPDELVKQEPAVPWVFRMI
jgi:hypothetical protein